MSEVKTRDIRELQSKVREWLGSELGRREVNQAAAAVRDAEERLRDARRVDPAMLLERVTL
jgi:hypothetical protein